MSSLAGEAFDRPVVEGLFRAEEDRIVLLGSRCEACGTLYFPQRVACRNPECAGSGDLSPAELPRKGTLYSYSWQAYQPPGLFAVDAWKPYAIGAVDLAENLRILARLDIPREKLRIGMEVVLGHDVMRRGEDGAVAGYVFREREGG